MPRLTCEKEDDREGHDLHRLSLRQPLQLEQQPLAHRAHLLYEVGGCHAAPGSCQGSCRAVPNREDLSPHEAGPKEPALSLTCSGKTSLSGLTHRTPGGSQGRKEASGPPPSP